MIHLFATFVVGLLVGWALARAWPIVRDEIFGEDIFRGFKVQMRTREWIDRPVVEWSVWEGFPSTNLVDTGRARDTAEATLQARAAIDLHLRGKAELEELRRRGERPLRIVELERELEEDRR